MQLFGKLVLSEFSDAFPESIGQVTAWRHEVEEANWSSLRQVQERYRNARVSKGGRVVFSLRKGLYLLDTSVRCDKGIVLVREARVEIATEGRTSRRSNNS